MKYQSLIKQMIIMLCFPILNSCLIESETCEEGLDSIKNDHINMVLHKLDNSWGGFRIDFTGKDIENNKSINFKTNSLSYPALNNYVEIGDTLKKDIGSNTFYLMKADSIIVFRALCKDGYGYDEIKNFQRPLSKGDSLVIEKLNQKE